MDCEAAQRGAAPKTPFREAESMLKMGYTVVGTGSFWGAPGDDRAGVAWWLVEQQSTKCAGGFSQQQQS